MTSLKNTKWSALLEYTEQGKTKTTNQTWEFNTDGTLTISNPNNSSSTAYYAESNGIFIFQKPSSSTNEKIEEVFSGKYIHSSGVGNWQQYQGNENESIISTFSMTKLDS